MFFLYDPFYLLIILVTFAVTGWASWRVKSAFGKYSRVAASSGMSGAEAAALMLRTAGLEGRVAIERVQGFLSDHYDSRKKVLRLSPPVYDGRSLAAVGVACHEVGHAIQDARNYLPLVARNAIVPMAGIGSNLGLYLVIFGLIFGAAEGTGIGYMMAVAGLVLFGTTVVFQLINLPVEFNASTRAKEMLPQMGVIRSGEESAGVAKVLDAAALTYVAATLMALVQMLYWAWRVFGNRR